MSDSILALNSNSAKFSTWIVRVLHGRISEYSFTSHIRKNTQKVNAQKFEAVLVGDNEKQYCQAIVRYHLKKPKAAQYAFTKYQNGTVWIMKTPGLQCNCKQQYNGAPNKNIVLLDSQTNLVNVLDGSELAKNVKSFIDPPMRLQDALALRSGMYFVDLVLYVTELGDIRTEMVGDCEAKVRTISVMDETAKACVTVWGVQTYGFDDCIGCAVLVLSAKVSEKNGLMELTIGESAYLSKTEGKREIELRKYCSSMDATQLRMVTAEGVRKPVNVEGEVSLACAALLEAMRGESQGADVPFRAMNVSVHGDNDRYETQDASRLYMRVVIRDWSGAAYAALLETSVLQYYGSKSKDQIDDAFKKGELKAVAQKWNIRGACRKHDILISEMRPTDITQVPSPQATKLSEVVGLCGQFSDGIFPCEVSRIISTGVVNLGVKIDSGDVLAPHRVIVFVQGTQKSTIEKICGGDCGRVIRSSKCRCLLAADAKDVNILAYAHENNLLGYKLDNESAIVHVSNVLEDGELVADFMHKVTPADVPRVKAACVAEYILATCQRTTLDFKRALEINEQKTPKKAKTLDAYHLDTCRE